MSDVSETRLERLNLDDVLARVELQQAGTRKFVADQLKLGAEQQKLVAEFLKLGRDRWLAPIITVASLVAAIAATLGAMVAILRH